MVMRVSADTALVLWAGAAMVKGCRRRCSVAVGGVVDPPMQELTRLITQSVVEAEAEVVVAFTRLVV